MERTDRVGSHHADAVQSKGSAREGSCTYASSWSSSRFDYPEVHVRVHVLGFGSIDETRGEVHNVNLRRTRAIPHCDFTPDDD